MSTFAKFVTMRALTVPIVLIAVITITYAVCSSVLDKALIAQWREQLQAQLQRNPKLVQQLIASGITPEQYVEQRLKALIHEKGLDKPWPLRLPGFIVRCFKFEFGKSYQLRSFTGSQDIKTIIFERVPFSILLFTTSTLIMVILGILLGVKCADKPGSKLDSSFTIYALLGQSIPMWWVGMIFILVFVYMFKLFPTPSETLATVADFIRTPITNFSQFLQKIPSLLYAMTLPLATVVIVNLGAYVYYIRSVVLTTMSEDFVFVARAKGVPEKDVLYKHVLRASSPGIITMVLLSLTGTIFGGAIITETVFSWPGMGLLYWDAIVMNDTPVVAVLTYVSALVYMATIVILDILYGILDPRIRVTGGLAR